MSEGIGRCRSCDAAIRWAVVGKTGKKIPLDLGRPVADQKPNVAFTGNLNDDLLPIVEIVAPGTGSRMTHFATCPNAVAHRTKKAAKAPAPERVLCSTIGCGIVIGANGKGAKAPRPCQKCEGEIRRTLTRNARARRARKRASR